MEKQKEWADIINAEYAKQYMIDLSARLEERAKSGIRIYPDKDNIFRCFKETEFKDVKVVILGQDFRK